jgi:hypothetical protein
MWLRACENARPPRESLRYQHRRRSDDDGVVKRAVGTLQGYLIQHSHTLSHTLPFSLSLRDDSKEDESEEEKRLEQRNT